MDSLNEQLQHLLTQGPFIAIGLAWLGGVLTSATPCVYPMLPITVGVIGASSEGSQIRGFLLSLVYVAGLAVVYGGLGVFAAASGQFFGEISTNPFGYFIVANLCLLFGAWMMGWIQFPQFGTQLNASTTGKTGWARIAMVFIAGCISGLVAAHVLPLCLRHYWLMWRQLAMWCSAACCYSPLPTGWAHCLFLQAHSQAFYPICQNRETG